MSAANIVRAEHFGGRTSTAINAALAAANHVQLLPETYTVTEPILLDGHVLEAPLGCTILVDESFDGDAVFRYVNRDDNDANVFNRFFINRLFVDLRNFSGSVAAFDLCGFRGGALTQCRVLGANTSREQVGVRFSDISPDGMSTKSTFFNSVSQMRIDLVNTAYLMESTAGNCNSNTIIGGSSYCRTFMDFGSGNNAIPTSVINTYTASDEDEDSSIFKAVTLRTLPPGFNMELLSAEDFPADFVSEAGSSSYVHQATRFYDAVIDRGLHRTLRYIPGSGTTFASPLSPSGFPAETFDGSMWVKIPSATELSAGANSYNFTTTGAAAGSSYLDAKIIAGHDDDVTGVFARWSSTTATVVVQATDAVTLAADMVILLRQVRV